MTDRSVKDNIVRIGFASFLRSFFDCAVTFPELSRHRIAQQSMTLRDYNRAVDEYADNLYRFVLKNLRDEHTSSDIVQDTFEKLWIKLETVDAAKVKSYLFTTAYHTLIDHIRRKKHEQEFRGMSKPEPFHSEQYSDIGEVLEWALNLSLIHI